MRAACSIAPLLLLFLCLAVNFQQYRAGRTLREQREEADARKLVRMEEARKLNLQSLSRGPVTPSGPSGCTYIPGGGGSKCPVSEKHFAGDPLRRPRASNPRSAFLFSVAADHYQKPLWSLSSFTPHSTHTHTHAGSTWHTQILLD